MAQGLHLARHLSTLWYIRVDPTAVCEGNTVTPMDIAAQSIPSHPSKEREEMISLLAEFTEMSDPVKLFYLSKLMYKGENKAKEKEKFKNILSSLSVELVSLPSIAIDMS